MNDKLQISQSSTRLIPCTCVVVVFARVLQVDIESLDLLVGVAAGNARGPAHLLVPEDVLAIVSMLIER